MTMRNLQRRTVLAVALAVIGLAGSAKAMDGPDLVGLTVVDRETGQPLRVWRHNGRAYVAGQPGARYGLRVSNHSGGRVLVVMSVDGVNVLTGETAGYGQGGYVFDPYESYAVSGWRKSDSEVAAFTFAPLPRSYAARTGRPGDVGVIGIAVFQERIVAPAAVAPAKESRSSASDDISEIVVTGSRVASSPGEPSPPALARREEKLGTGHGAREWSAVTAVAFQRATAAPLFTRQIEYDTFANLAALGVIRPPPAIGRRPRPFPSSGAGYVPDPPGMP
jgi:hypothetical protein